MPHQSWLKNSFKSKNIIGVFYRFIAPIVLSGLFAIQPLSAQSDFETTADLADLVQLFKSKGYDGTDSIVAPKIFDTRSQTVMPGPENATQRNVSVDSEKVTAEESEVAEEVTANEMTTYAQTGAEIINSEEAAQTNDAATIVNTNSVVTSAQPDLGSGINENNAKPVQSPQATPQHKVTGISGANATTQPENQPVASSRPNRNFDRPQAIAPSQPARPLDQNTQALFEALSNQNTPRALSLIKLGADVNAINNSGQTMLMMAIQNANASVVKAMIEQGTNINARDKWGWNALLSATIKGKKEIVELLLDAGADPNMIGNDRRSAVMAASWNRNHGILNVLINSDANVNIQNRDGWTALSFAAWNGDETAVRVLLSASADKTIRNNEGETALMIAEQAGHPDIAYLLR